MRCLSTQCWTPISIWLLLKTIKCFKKLAITNLFFINKIIYRKYLTIGAYFLKNLFQFSKKHEKEAESLVGEIVQSQSHKRVMSCQLKNLLYQIHQFLQFAILNLIKRQRSAHKIGLNLTCRLFFVYILTTNKVLMEKWASLWMLALYAYIKFINSVLQFW